MPYVVTIAAPAAAARPSSDSAGAAAPPSRITRNRDRSTPASSSRPSWVGTSETRVAPLAATAPTSNRSCTDQRDAQPP